MKENQRHDLFERWMADHIAILYRVVNGFADGDDRSDLMQEVLLAVWHAIPHFRAESKPTTFLYRVSHNAALTWRRTRLNYRNRIEKAAEFAAIDLQPDHAPAHDPRLDQLYAAIRSLPELDRSLILLSLDGVSYVEMAAIHGLSESNVGVRLNRIKQRLTKEMEKPYELR